MRPASLRHWCPVETDFCKLEKDLIKIRKNRNSTYTSDICSKNEKGKLIYTDIVKSLLKEQGFICAYCMQKIDIENCSIEHIIGQSFNAKNCDKKQKEFDYNEIKLDRKSFFKHMDSSINVNDDCIGKINSTNYKNMLAVCTSKTHCDKSRANYQAKRPILYISPFNKNHMQNLKFSQSGVLYYKEFPDKMVKNEETREDKEIRYDIDVVLNLNCETLKEERSKIISSIKSILVKSSFNKDKVKNLLYSWEQKSTVYKEYCQVAISELRKHYS